MIQFTIDLKELSQFKESIGHLNIKEPLWEVVRTASRNAMSQIKKEMPVDTGRARASWGVFDASGLSGRSRLRAPRNVRRYKVKGRKTGREDIATSEDAIYIEDPDAMTVVQGTYVPYTEALNNGHSKKAPAGFIDNAILSIGVKIEEYEKELVDSIQWETGKPVQTTFTAKDRNANGLLNRYLGPL